MQEQRTANRYASTDCKDLVQVESRIDRGTGRGDGATKPTRSFSGMSSTKWCPAELGMRKESAPLGQQHFQVLFKLSSVKKGPGAHLLLSMFKRHLGKSIRRQICSYNVSPWRAVSAQRLSRVHVSDVGTAMLAGVLVFSETPVGIVSSRSSPGSEWCGRQQSPQPDLPTVHTLSQQPWPRF